MFNRTVQQVLTRFDLLGGTSVSCSFSFPSSNERTTGCVCSVCVCACMCARACVLMRVCDHREPFFRRLTFTLCVTTPNLFWNNLKALGSIQHHSGALSALQQPVDHFVCPW